MQYHINIGSEQRHELVILGFSQWLLIRLLGSTALYLAYPRELITYASYNMHCHNSLSQFLAKYGNNNKLFK